MDIWRFNLRHLRALATAVELESVSATARAISLTQPAVTQALSRLENEIGASFFERRPDGLKPKPAAIILAKRIRPALELIGSHRATSTQVRSFLAVAQTTSYAGASQMTGLKEPSLHRAVNDLELSLGTKLVERRGRGLMLTKKGERTARNFRLAARELEAGLSELAALEGRIVDHFGIGAMPLSRARLLPDVLVRFLEKHPDVTVSVHEGAHMDLIERLRDGELDMIIGALRTPPPGRDVVQTFLFEDSPVVIGRPEHPILTGLDTAPTPAALAKFDWLIADQGAPLREGWARMFHEAGVAPPNVPISSGSAILIRQILLQTDCLTLLSPDQLKMELEKGVLVKICDAPEWVSRSIGVTTRADWRPTSIQSELIEQIKASSEYHN